MNLNRPLYKTLHILRQIYWHLFKPNTQGVGIIIISQNNEVLLIKHSYKDKLHLPGGGVKKSETFKEAIVRETKEEVGVTIKEDNLKFLEVYQSKEEGKNDVISVFLCKLTSTPAVKVDNKEIISGKFYALNSLPDNLSAATKRRLEEYKKGDYPITGKW